MIRTVHRALRSVEAAVYATLRVEASPSAMGYPRAPNCPPSLPRFNSDAPPGFYGTRAYSTSQKQAELGWRGRFKDMKVSEVINTRIVQGSVGALLFGGLGLLWKSYKGSGTREYIEAACKVNANVPPDVSDYASPVEALDTRANDINWLNNKWKYTLKSESNHIDRSADITRILELGTGRMLIVEGMERIGKTTFLLDLCKHQMQEQQPALYLEFHYILRERIEDIFRTRLGAVRELQREYQKKGKQLTIVIDDFHKLLQEKANDQTGRELSNLFWELTQSGV